MNKKELVLSLLDDNKDTPYIPAGFFIHFDPAAHRGQKAIDKHLEYFHYTGMDFVKIQYENRFPARTDINKPEDWVKMPCYGLDFYEDQINIAKGLVDKAGKESLVLMTLYSPFMFAGQTVGKKIISKHLQENPEAVKKGLEIISESLMHFIQGCVEIGLDGFYHSTQGGEKNRFGGSPIFEKYIKPYDLVLMDEIDRLCQFNILHICDYEGGYVDLSPYLEYPGHIVNASLQIGDDFTSSRELYNFFNRPFMGGMDRFGVIAKGSTNEIISSVNEICENAPNKYILGADCTLPGETNWENIKAAINTAHKFLK